jgi:hypothetical protein
MKTFKFNTDRNSFWINYKESINYTVSSKSIEVDKVDVLVEAILLEFVHTSEDEKVKFRKHLSTWLNSMTDEDLNLEGVEMVRDFIYEMY